MRTYIALFICAALSATVAAQGPQNRPPSVAITGGTLINVITGEQIKDSRILIEGDRIKQLGRAGEITIPQSAQTIDARGKWIIPGSIDMHTHGAGRRDLPLELYLAQGVTTIRDVAGQLTSLRITRDEIISGKRVGPRLFFAGYILDGDPPVWPQGSLLIDTPERAESAVNFLIDQGADCIKVYNNISEPVLGAIIRTARMRNIPVTGHAPRSMTMAQAVELGMDCLEHIRITGKDLLPLDEANKLDPLPVARREALLWQRFDLGSEKMNRLISLLAQRKVFLEPTLTADEVMSVDGYEAQAADPNNRFLPRRLFDEWARRPTPDMFKVPPELKQAAAAGFKKRKQFVAMCKTAGVPIIAGTDGAFLGKLLPGFGLQRELELLVQSGLKPIEAIQAATINAARLLKRERELGVIEANRVADIVILDADPLEDIRNTRKIHLVMKGGQTFDPTRLLNGQNPAQR